MRKFYVTIISLIIFAAVVLSTGLFLQHLGSTHTTHIIPASIIRRKVTRGDKSAFFTAGFQIDTASDAYNAANSGIQQAFTYGDIHAEDSDLGRTFKSLHIKQVDGGISSYLYQYECHRLYQQHFHLQHFCSQDYPGMDHQRLITLVKAEIASAKRTTLRAGYWILDDWPGADEGSAKSLLREITSIIHSEDPGIRSICGFGAELGVNYEDLLNPAVVENYAPGGCDIVGIYIYSQSVTDPGTSDSTFDWSMSTLLPRMLNGLSQQGWDQKKVPLMGIAQAWAGIRADFPGYYEIAPTAQDIEMQSLSFCQSGAIGINYYGWNDSTVRNMQTPANNAQIKQGVIDGIKACENYWGF
ncbi:MAG: hypothetical protein M3Z08_04065 [Chloroflexota bacterium]|nr:hypothetical protein [Chloroflexota bacterium]